MPHEGPKLTLRQLTRVICEHVHVHVSRKALEPLEEARKKRQTGDTPLYLGHSCPKLPSYLG